MVKRFVGDQAVTPGKDLSQDHNKSNDGVVTNIRPGAEPVVNELCDSHSWVTMSSSELGSKYKEEQCAACPAEGAGKNYENVIVQFCARGSDSGGVQRVSGAMSSHDEGHDR